MMMTLGSQQQRFGTPSLDHMSPYSTPPQFTNPWTSTSPASHGSQAMYSRSPALSHKSLGSGSESIGKLNAAARSTSSAPTSMGSFATVPVTASSASATIKLEAFGRRDLLSTAQDVISLNRVQTTSSASPVPVTYAASPTHFDGGLAGYAPAPVRPTFAVAPDADSRRYSQSSVSSAPTSDSSSGDSYLSRRSPLIDLKRSGMRQDDRKSFADALDAGHGMLAMSQDTPRAVYPPGRSCARAPRESYAFPSTHSNSSSISSASYGSNTGGYFGASSVDSVSDYSTAGSDIESVASRTLLPRPDLMSQPPPPLIPASMMSQFNSKVSSTALKRHKCKVCDKRFTRPSSLQTHMYSHTGEKPFACDVEGCGRHFSVVSNLRRHRKVHNIEHHSDARSEGRRPSK